MGDPTMPFADASALAFLNERTRQHVVSRAEEIARLICVNDFDNSYFYRYNITGDAVYMNLTSFFEQERMSHPNLFAWVEEALAHEIVDIFLAAGWTASLSLLNQSLLKWNLPLVKRKPPIYQLKLFHRTWLDEERATCFSCGRVRSTRIVPDGVVTARAIRRKVADRASLMASDIVERISRNSFDNSHVKLGKDRQGRTRHRVDLTAMLAGERDWDPIWSGECSAIKIKLMALLRPMGFFLELSDFEHHRRTPRRPDRHIMYLDGLPGGSARSTCHCRQL
jgi:hypothetical protein